VINGKIKSVGKVPKKEELRDLIKKEIKIKDNSSFSS